MEDADGILMILIPLCDFDFGFGFLVLKMVGIFSMAFRNFKMMWLGLASFAFSSF